MAADTEPVWASRIHTPPLVGIMFQVVAVFENEETGRYDIGEWWWASTGQTPPPAPQSFEKLGQALQTIAR